MRDGFGGVEVFGGPEGEGKEESGDECEACGVEEEVAVVDGAVGGGEFALEGDEDPFGSEVANTEDEEVEEGLGAGADVFGEGCVDEDVEGGEEEGVADAVEDLDGDDHGLIFGHEGEYAKAGGVAEDAEGHGGLPTEAGEEPAEDGHGEDFGDLADGHDGHDPLRFDADGGAAEEAAGHDEVAVVDGGVDEGDDEEDEEEGFFEEGDGAEPGETAFTGLGGFGRGVGEAEAVGGEGEGGDAGDEEDVAGGSDSFGTDFALKDEVEGPGGEHPADGAAHADDAEFLLRVLQVAEGQGVGDGDGGDVEERVDEHESEEDGETGGPVHGEDGDAADEVAEGHEFFGGEVAVGELGGEEDADDGSNGEGGADPGGLAFGEVEAVLAHVAPDEGEPSAPDEELQDHHDEELVAFGGVGGGSHENCQWVGSGPVGSLKRGIRGGKEEMSKRC